MLQEHRLESRFVHLLSSSADFLAISILFVTVKTEKNAKVIYMYIETRIKLKEGEVALVLLSAQAEETLQKRKFCICVCAIQDFVQRL